MLKCIFTGLSYLIQLVIIHVWIVISWLAKCKPNIQIVPHYITHHAHFLSAVWWILRWSCESFSLLCLHGQLLNTVLQTNWNQIRVIICTLYSHLKIKKTVVGSYNTETSPQPNLSMPTKLSSLTGPVCLHLTQIPPNVYSQTCPNVFCML